MCISSLYASVCPDIPTRLPGTSAMDTQLQKTPTPCTKTKNTHPARAHPPTRLRRDSPEGAGTFSMGHATFEEFVSSQKSKLKTHHPINQHLLSHTFHRPQWSEPAALSWCYARSWLLLQVTIEKFRWATPFIDQSSLPLRTLILRLDLGLQIHGLGR